MALRSYESKAVFNDAELYRAWIDFLHDYKRIVRGMKDKSKAEKLKIYINRCRDRKHDYRAGYSYCPIMEVYTWRH